MQPPVAIQDLDIPISPRARVTPIWWVAMKWPTESRLACGLNTFGQRHP
jgi:hypothetical protein